jgi:hypothetical protein
MAIRAVTVEYDKDGNVVYYHINSDCPPPIGILFEKSDEVKLIKQLEGLKKPLLDKEKKVK